MFWLFDGECPLCERRAPGALCRRCEQVVESGCFAPTLKVVAEGLPVRAWGVYNQELRRLLECLKYHGRADLGDWLGERLGRWWLTAGLPTAGMQVTAVPLHVERFRRRGYNQAERIARAFARRTGLRFQDVLYRTQATPALHGLGPAERAGVLAGAFRARRLCGGQRFVIVDDILTTGTTLALCARALAQAGGTPTLGLVVAHPRLDRGSPEADA